MTRGATTIIGLTGRAGSGKDTAASYLCQHYGFVRASFAEGPRVMLEALLSYLNVDHAWLFEPTLKEQAMPVVLHSYRRLMQTLGTEWGRHRLDEGLWLRVLESHLGLGLQQPVHDRIVITDCRYPNEAHWLRFQRAHLVGITRRQAPAVRNHCSEDHAEMLYAQADSLIANDDHVEVLYDQLQLLATQLGIDRRPLVFHEG